MGSADAVLGSAERCFGAAFQPNLLEEAVVHEHRHAGGLAAVRALPLVLGARRRGRVTKKDTSE